jgi:nitroreductase
MFDCGLLSQNIMLLAAAQGLGTAPLIQAAAYPDVLRKILEVPESKLILLGIAIGYPDWDDPINSFRSERAPMDEVVRWC